MASPSQVLDYMASVKASLGNALVRQAISPVVYTSGMSPLSTAAGNKAPETPRHRPFGLHGEAHAMPDHAPLTPSVYGRETWGTDDFDKLNDWDLQKQYVANKFADDEIRRLEMSHVFTVVPDMVDLTEFAARTFPEGAPLRKENIPTDFGFVYFEKPLASIDIHGKPMRHHAVTWGPDIDDVRGWYRGEARTVENARTFREHGLRVNFYSDRDDTVDAYTSSLREKYSETDVWRAYRFQLSESVFWSWNATWQPYEDEVKLYREVEGIDFDALPMMPTSESAMAHRMMSFWTLCMQEVADLREGEVDRHAKKRMGRANLPHRVTVVTLRRRSGRTAEGESMVEWHHRWIVRGHWRQQPYKNKDTGEIYTQPIWIAPYVKGPEDKPLIQSDKVYRLAR